MLWSALWLAIGFVTSISQVDLKPKIFEFLERLFREILGQEELVINFSSVSLIFKNNLQAAVVIMFAGVILGIVPILSLALNFFILGFLGGAFALKPIFFATVLPHGIIEIPAFIIAAAFGIRFGFFWKIPDDLTDWQKFVMCFKQNWQILGLVAILFFLAAVIEVFVSGQIAENFAK